MSPFVDVMCVGGASILVLLPLILTRQKAILGRDLVLYPWLDSVGAWLALLINLPHFMASYRMVYRSRETVLKHPWASLYVPGILLAYSAFAVAMPRSSWQWTEIVMPSCIPGVCLMMPSISAKYSSGVV